MERKERSEEGEIEEASFDVSGLNYDSDEHNGDGKIEESVKNNGGSNSNANSTVTGGGVGDQKGKKKGMPAKNLMAERRRRKRLNDRLYMLRSVVPKISKVEVRVREGRAVNIHMFCARRPGLLLSTMRALDNLGLIFSRLSSVVSMGLHSMCFELRKALQFYHQGSIVDRQWDIVGARQFPLLFQQIIVNFCTSWCSHSKSIAPAYCDLADKYPSIIFLSIDTDKLPEFSSSWEVKSTPTFFFLKDGRQVDKLVGADKPELQKKTAAVSSLPNDSRALNHLKANEDIVNLDKKALISPKELQKRLC
ncbi:hypothetical protein GH714_029500 [Hevea brasiliensis]|uniref:Thioredoxin domain-containing protein n=1 Tax=Hevea brasiliensis TaxID=3981 RepID=A0A6A6LK21_HEVBR|nr:hypothetical protein GH714_029500 [Hevea brasiliensis]